MWIIVGVHVRPIASTKKVPLFFFFICHPHVFSRRCRQSVCLFPSQGSPQRTSWKIWETEGSVSGGQRGGVKRGVKSAFALQFGMTLIIWSGPFWGRRRLPVTTDVDYTKQASLKGRENKTQGHTHTHTELIHTNKHSHSPTGLLLVLCHQY